MNPDKRQYVFNLETTKIELHFEKAEYDAFSDEQKREIKGAFLWSSRGKCWVSRAKEPHLWRAKQVAEKLGFSGEQREGERLTYAEQLERQAERAEARAERYEGYAANAEGRAAQLQKPLESRRGGYTANITGALRNTARANTSRTGRQRRGGPRRRRSLTTRPISTAV